jgi:LPS export ABC transporter protein LptC
MLSTRLKITILLLVLLAGILFITHPKHNDNAPSKSEAHAQQPLWQFNQVERWQIIPSKTEESPQKLYLKAEQTRAYRSNDQHSTLMFQTPLVWLIQATQVAKLQSLTAQSLDNEEITFKQQVMVDLFSQKDPMPIHLSTEQLSYREDQLYSPTFVKIVQGLNQTEGEEMIANLQTHSVEIRHNVYSLFQPQADRHVAEQPTN